ncbi:unnamed protein product [Nesidiocoris tenuis]|uniref:Uncharacterized protein n=1 Tax=Nesidiocoris tenuis TaxID=355587 RepID=A0A6H5G3M4_9HEMI|nr:unnamed protein product [Nesidiocoris tenuis]
MLVLGDDRSKGGQKAVFCPASKAASIGQLVYSCSVYTCGQVFGGFASRCKLKALSSRTRSILSMGVFPYKRRKNEMISQLNCPNLRPNANLFTSAFRIRPISFGVRQFSAPFRWPSSRTDELSQFLFNVLHSIAGFIRPLIDGLEGDSLFVAISAKMVKKRTFYSLIKHYKYAQHKLISYKTRTNFF